MIITSIQVNGNYFMTAADEFVTADTRTADVLISLPPVFPAANKTYWLHTNSVSFSCTVVPRETSGVFIKNHTTTNFSSIAVRTRFRWIRFISDGSNWYWDEVTPDLVLDDMDESTVKGRAPGTGFGPPTNLHQFHLRDILAYDASLIPYDNVGSLLLASDVQAAIDEIDALIDVLTIATVLTGTFSLSGAITASFSGTQNNFNPAGLSGATVVRLNGSSTPIITGIAGGATGRVLILINISATTTFLKHNDAGSTGGNRIYFPNAGDVTLARGAALVLYYHTLWNCLTPVDAGAGSAAPGLVKIDGNVANFLAGDGSMQPVPFPDGDYTDATISGSRTVIKVKKPWVKPFLMMAR